MSLLLFFSILNFNFKLGEGCRFVFLKDLDGDDKKEVILLNKENLVSILEFDNGILKHMIKENFQGNIIDFGDLYPDIEGDEIVVIHFSGIDIFKYNGNKINLLNSINLESSFLYSQNSKILRSGNFIYDLGNKKVIVFFYTDKGVILDKDGAIEKIPLMPEIRISTFSDKATPLEGEDIFSLKTSFVLPVIFFSDIDGNGKSDLIQFSKDTLFIFLRKNENFSAKRDLYLGLSFLKSEKMEIFPPRIWVKDINNDGKGDVIVSKAEIGIPFGKKSAIYLFLNKDGTFGHVPDQVLISESFLPEIHLADFNKDEKIDLLLNTAGFNLFSLIKLILMKKINLEYSLYLFKENSFSKNPVYSKGFEFSANVSEEESEGSIDFLHDFDNDGFFDIFYFKKDGIEVFKGRGKDFEKKSCFFYKINTSASYFIEDIDGNGNVDFLFWRTKKKETEIWGFLR